MGDVVRAGVHRQPTPDRQPAAVTRSGSRVAMRPAPWWYESGLLAEPQLLVRTRPPGRRWQVEINGDRVTVQLHHHTANGRHLILQSTMSRELFAMKDPRLATVRTMSYTMNGAASQVLNRGDQIRLPGVARGSRGGLGAQPAGQTGNEPDPA